MEYHTAIKNNITYVDNRVVYNDAQSEATYMSSFRDHSEGIRVSSRG